MMRHTQITHLCMISGILAMLGACGGPRAQAVQVNTPQMRSFEVGKRALFDAVRRNVQQQGWKIQRADYSQGVVEALEPATDAEGFVTRPRWLFAIDSGHVTVQMFLDFMDGDNWKSYSVVCDGYSYSQERSQLQNIAELVSTGHREISAGGG